MARVTSTALAALDGRGVDVEAAIEVVRDGELFEAERVGGGVLCRVLEVDHGPARTELHLPRRASGPRCLARRRAHSSSRTEWKVTRQRSKQPRVS